MLNDTKLIFKNVTITYNDFNDPVETVTSEKIVFGEQVNVFAKEHQSLVLKHNFKKTIQFKIYKSEYSNQDSFYYNNKKWTIIQVKNLKKERDKILILGTI